MGFLSFQARPLTMLVEGASSEWTNGDTFDIRDAVAVYALLKVTATSGTLDVKWEYSVDGYHWEPGTSFTQASAATAELKSETTTANITGRYIRFLYKLAANGEATFSIDVFTRNYS